MRLQSLVVAFLAVVAGAFVLLNLDIVVEARSVQLPGGHLTIPIVGITLLVAVGALIGMLLLSVAEDFSRRRTQRRLYARLAQSEHELALVKSAAYDRVAPLLEATHREISMWIEGETPAGAPADPAGRAAARRAGAAPRRGGPRGGCLPGGD